ncbi:MAG: hypothetical protein HY329_25145, partial [Chloroflexi bacterium]|nr:hypothetical protein [Chloroflexota bacterium]
MAAKNPAVRSEGSPTVAQANGIGPVVATAAAPIERMSELLRTLSFDVDSGLPGVLDSQTRAMASMRTLIEVQETVRKRLVKAGHEAEGLEQLELLQMQEMSSFFGEAEQATRRERRLAQDRARRILERAETELRELYEETGRRCREHWQLALDDARGAISAAQQVALAMTGEPLPVAVALPRPAEAIANGAGDGETGNQTAAKLRLVALPGTDETPQPAVAVAASEPAGARTGAPAQLSATVAPAPGDSPASLARPSFAAPPAVMTPYPALDTVPPSSAQTATPTNAAQPTDVAPAPEPASASDSFMAAGGNTMTVAAPAEETPAEDTPAE